MGLFPKLKPEPDSSASNRACHAKKILCPFAQTEFAASTSMLDCGTSGLPRASMLIKSKYCKLDVLRHRLECVAQRGGELVQWKVQEECFCANDSSVQIWQE